MSFLLNLFDDLGKVFVEFEDFLICSYDPFQLSVVKVLIVSISDD